MSSALNYFKYLLTVAGAKCSASRLVHLQAVVNYLRTGRWMAERGFRFKHRLPSRRAVLDFVASKVKDARVLYLEFGVYRGDSMRFWSQKLAHPDARLHGFDSFEGLPEDWGKFSKGHFGVNGEVPEIRDPRVSFFKGWFEDILPKYSAPPHDALVIAMDADLYSSSIYVLRQLRAIIKPGTYIYFDEMNQVEHEPRAFDDFMKESSLRFVPICADLSLAHAVFECQGTGAAARRSS